MSEGRAVEMPARGRRGKPKAGFPPRPQALEIAEGAIPTFPPPRLFSLSWIKQTGKNLVCAVEKWKSKGTIPTFPPHRQ